MESWQLKIIDEAVACITTQLPADQARLEALIAAGPAATLALEMAKTVHEKNYAIVRWHVMYRFLEVLSEHVNRADTSKTQLLDMAVNKLSAFQNFVPSMDELEFARAVSNKEIDPELARSIELNYMGKWRVGQQAMLSCVVTMRKFFDLHLSDLVDSAKAKKKSSIHS